MLCEYCKMNEIDTDGDSYKDHIICDDCFEYLETFCELEESLAAEKSRRMKLEAKLELAKMLIEGMMARSVQLEDVILEAQRENNGRS